MDSSRLCGLVASLVLMTAFVVPRASAEEETAPETEAEAETEKPGPTLEFSQLVGFAAWPLGLLFDSRLEVRAPLHRSSSMVFQETYAAAGGRVAITPAFASVGPRLTLAPIDVFDLVVMANATVNWPSSSGLLPYESIYESTVDSDRNDLFDNPAPGREVRLGAGFDLRVQPTVKIKLGPIIAFSAWDFSWVWLRRPDDIETPYVYEPYRDRIVQWHDLVVENQSAIVGEILPGEGGPLLWIGATYHDIWAIGSRDRSIQIGPIVVFKPSFKRGWPRLVLQVKPYVMDHDRVGGPPRIAVAAIWSASKPLGASAEAGD